MATAAQIYGQIGAAKVFSSNVSNALGINNEAALQNQEKINQLKNQLDNEQDNTEKQKIRKKIVRLEKKNKVVGYFNKQSNNATDFLAKICSFMDISVDYIIRFVSNFLVAELPSLEVAIKMLILTNIKKMVGCSIDPMIPDTWRTNGVIINENEIDPRSLLKNSPYSKWGRYRYFGCYERDNDDILTRQTLTENYEKPIPPIELTRAEDMNAFIWFAKNCAKFVSPTIIPYGEMDNYFNCNPNLTLEDISKMDGVQGKNDHVFVEGCSFKDSGSTQNYVCYARYVENENLYYSLRKTGDNVTYDGGTSVNWYKFRTVLSGVEQINMKNEKPLFNIEYRSNYPEAPSYRSGNFKFRILPKPFSTAGGFIVDLQNNTNTLFDVAGNTVSESIGNELMSGGTNYTFSGIQSPLPHVARFNDKGIYDRKGKYSINLRKYIVYQDNNDGDKIYYSIYETIGSEAPKAKMVFNKSDKSFQLLDPQEQTTALKPEDCIPLITECYFGTTIYEFNYDYLLSMRLFDPKTVASGIVNAMLNIDIPNTYDISDIFKKNGINDNSDVMSNGDQIRIDAYVDRLIEKMIDNEQNEFTNCFYDFNNEEYEKLEKKVANEIANGTLVTNTDNNPVQEVYDILNAYNADADLNTRKEVITNAIIKAVEKSGLPVSDYNSDTDGIIPSAEDKSQVSTFIDNIIKFLTTEIVNSLFTPKVLMLIEVNRRMMGINAIPGSVGELTRRYDSSDIEQVLDGLSGILKDVIRQIITAIQQELLRLIMERLGEMMAGYIKRLGLEYAKKWADIVRMLFGCINSRNGYRGVFGNAYQNSDTVASIIDQVDYADIYKNIDDIIPNTNPC